MNLVNEIITVSLLLIVINIIFWMISNNISKKVKEKDNKDLESKINKIKNIFILIFGILVFATLLDLYNIIIKNTNSYVHVLGIFKFAKINTGYLNTVFIFVVGQLILYLDIVVLLLLRKFKKRTIVTAIFVLLYIFICAYGLYTPYMFYKNAKQYEYLNNYDIIEDFKEDDQISKDGALKILKDEFKCDYIANVEAELVKLDELDDITIKYSCDFEEFWIVTFDYMINYEIKENVCAFVDLYTGQVSYLTY